MSAALIVAVRDRDQMYRSEGGSGSGAKLSCRGRARQQRAHLIKCLPGTAQHSVAGVPAAPALRPLYLRQSDCDDEALKYISLILMY